jgi:hypothetical protein
MVAEGHCRPDHHLGQVRQAHEPIEARAVAVDATGHDTAWRRRLPQALPIG